jgi:DNA-binding GntR family transcriptional regulator
MKERGGLIWPDEAAKELGYSVLDILEALRKLEKEGRAARNDLPNQKKMVVQVSLSAKLAQTKLIT